MSRPLCLLRPAAAMASWVALATAWAGHYALRAGQNPSGGTRIICSLVAAIGPGLICAQHNGSGGYPVPPELAARIAAQRAKRNEAREHLRLGRVQQAIQVFTEAAAMEDALGGPFSGTKYELAKALVQAGREEEALAAYRRCFWWDPRRGDLATNGPPQVRLAMDYAMLLAKRGKVAEAKAIYYFGLRGFNPLKDRIKEPFPLLIVFDPDSEGIYWEYTPDRLKAAALMAKALHGDEEKAFLQQARELVPDSFYPPLLQAARGKGLADKIAQAQGLARPGLEREIVAKYLSDLAEHRQWLIQMDYVSAPDARPMTEGNLRRGRMAVLAPNEAMLRRLSLGGSG